MATLLQDFKFGCRMLAKNPGFTAVALITLTLGIGANSTIFSWINATLLDPIPGLRATGDLISIMRGERRDNPTPPFSYPDYVDLQQRNRSFVNLLAYHDTSMSLTGSAKPERILGTLASTNFFEALGVRPVLGRGFLPEDERHAGGTPVAVISYGLWNSRFGTELSVIGRTISINRQSFTVVGVAPPAFQGCKIGIRSELWVPLTIDSALHGWSRLQQRETAWLQLLGRLKSGISNRQAEEDLNLQMEHIVNEYPAAHPGSNQISLDPLWRSPFGAGASLYRLLPVLMAISGFVLLLACVNVANLLLVRSVGRRREMAIRLSLGASRPHLLSQLLAESLVLSLAGGACAVWLTSWAAPAIGHLTPASSGATPPEIRLDGSVFLATLGISILASILFGILPAFRSAGLQPVTVLKEETGGLTGGGRKMRLTQGFVMAQIALSMLLLICTVLLVRTLQNAERFHPGFDAQGVLLASFDLHTLGYTDAAAREFDKQLLGKLEELPGVESVTLSNWVPLGSGKHSATIQPEGYPPRINESLIVRRANVGPNFLRTLRIPLLSGRDFTTTDTSKSQRVAIVNQALADRHWPKQDPLGKRIRVQDEWFTVVGIARNTSYSRVNEVPQPLIFLPLQQVFYHDAVVLARVSGNPQTMPSSIQKAIHELNPELALFNQATLASVVRAASTLERIAATFVGVLGLIALALAAVGIYGVVAYSTSRRTREMGIRMALGAKRTQIFQLVVGQGLVLTLFGLAIGFSLSLAVTRLLRGMLFGVAATDPLTYAGVSALMCLVVFAACYIPARRAATVNPIEALRYE